MHRDVGILGSFIFTTLPTDILLLWLSYLLNISSQYLPYIISSPIIKALVAQGNDTVLLLYFLESSDNEHRKELLILSFHIFFIQMNFFGLRKIYQGLKIENFVRSKFLLIHVRFFKSNLNIGRVAFGRTRTWSRWLNKEPDIKRKYKFVSLDRINKHHALCQELVGK